jgi:hypothetical protein
VKLAHWLQELTESPAVLAESIRSPLTVTPAGASTGPPPSASGHAEFGQPGVGSEFISLMAHTFFV